MSFPTHSDSTELSNEAWWNSNPQFSEWVELPASEVGEGTIAGDTSEKNVSMSADIIQGQDESQTFIVPGLNPHLGSRFESTQSPTGLQLDGPNGEGGFGASHHIQSAAAFPSLVDQAIMDFGQNDSCLILPGGPAGGAGLDAGHYAQGATGFPPDDQHVMADINVAGPWDVQYGKQD